MKARYVFPLAFVFVLYLGLPAFAQHGRGLGGGMGGGLGGMPGSSSGERKGLSGSETGLPDKQHPEGENSAGSTGKKTVSDLLTKNAKLSSNLQGLLPAGTNLQDAAKGFAHLGDFVAAVHVSHNLSIPFDQLKGKMVNGRSLGQAIHELRPNVNAREEAIKGNEQALQDMEKSMAQSKSVSGRQ